MKKFFHALQVLIVVSLTVGVMTRIAADGLVLPQAAPPLQPLKAQLFAIQGEVYALGDATGRFVLVRTIGL
jgi:hypothetical protein